MHFPSSAPRCFHSQVRPRPLSTQRSLLPYEVPRALTHLTLHRTIQVRNLLLRLLWVQPLSSRNHNSRVSHLRSDYLVAVRPPSQPTPAASSSLKDGMTPMASSIRRKHYPGSVSRSTPGKPLRTAATSPSEHSPVSPSYPTP